LYDKANRDDRSDYAQLHELCNLIDSKPIEFNIKSIDAVKGLEADTCVFVLTPNTYKYFVQDIGEDKYFNTIWKKLYVALTRAKKELILVIDHELFIKQDVSEVKRRLEELLVEKLL